MAHGGGKEPFLYKNLQMVQITNISCEIVCFFWLPNSMIHLFIRNHWAFLELWRLHWSVSDIAWFTNDLFFYPSLNTQRA